MLRLNEKLSEVQLLRLRATILALPLFFFGGGGRTQILRRYARKKYATVEINPKRRVFQNSLLQKLLGERVQAFGASMSGIVWEDGIQGNH